MTLSATMPSLFVDEPQDWTFKGHPTRLLTHCYHDYPAKMIPQIASRLVEMYGKDADLLFDPYCGTGTSLVAANTIGLDAIGTDLNPLAQLMSQAKTAHPAVKSVESTIERFMKVFIHAKPDNRDIPSVEGIRIEFWFKPEVIEKLAILRHFIDRIDDHPVRLFFQTAFSETVRESSNTRIGEFKLYRYTEEKLKSYNPDVFGIMSSKLARNLSGLLDYVAAISKLPRKPISKVYGFNTLDGIPRDIIKPRSIDLVVTSPPYGDSHTTVAYGQYSRLSLAWLGFKGAGGVDNTLMGGTTLKEIPHFPCKSLNQAIRAIADADLKRAKEVSAFYVDLGKSISNVATTIKTNGAACYVVGNRKVKGVVLPTNEAIRSFFEEHGFEFDNEFTRGIPNKRMPARNSPSNVTGELDATMTQEFIVVMKND